VSLATAVPVAAEALIQSPAAHRRFATLVISTSKWLRTTGLDIGCEILIKSESFKRDLKYLPMGNWLEQSNVKWSNLALG
jgi:hypothetical protein